MKKTKKALASLAIAGMTLSMVPFNVFAASPARLSGNTAEQTAVSIADQTGWTGSAILASSTSYGMVDALTAGPLASYLQAPILLTGAGSTLNADTKAELSKLDVKTVYVTSGTAVIKQGVLDELAGMGITVVPLGGYDRAETSVNIAKKMTGVTKVAVANSIPDALSIAAIAAASNEPILLTDKNELPASVASYLAANPEITASDVVGGTGVISDAVKAKLPSATRHAGMSAYDTNSQVIQDFDAALEYGNVYLANGVTGIDALAGAPLAAQTKSAIVLTDGKTVPAAASFVHGKLADDSVVTAIGGSAVVPETIRTGVVSGNVTPPTGALSVTSVSAVSADSFKVVFNHAPADTAKVTVDVTRATTPVTTTLTWNAANTEATVTSSQKLPEGTYSVAVKNDTADLGTSTVAVTAQKIAKISITSTKLGVQSVTTGTAIGYATYSVYDQYGVDITNGSLANNLTFQTGVGSATGRNGIIKVTPTMNLLQFQTVVVTGYDSSSGISTSATLSVSTQVGTLNTIKLGDLTNADGKKLTSGDTSTLFYIDYTATDLSGNETKDYDLVHDGLILNSSDEITTSSYVSAKVVHDPSDSNKAAIQVQVLPSTDLTVDLPLVLTAMTYTGSTSTLNTTLYKASAVDTFTLMAPAYDIAVNDSKEIPFVAYDQNGEQLTKYSDLKDVTISGTGITKGENVDGTFKITFKPTSKGTQVITATTATGKYSSLTINVQERAVADTLDVDGSVLVSTMQAAKQADGTVATTTGSAISKATQGLDFGWDNGGLTLKDQYGRVIDMTTADSTSAASHYSVTIASSDSSVVYAEGSASIGNNEFKLTALKPGTATLTLKLYNTDTKKPDNVTDRDPSVAVDTKTVTVSVIKDDDIKDYTVTSTDKPLYAANTTPGAISAIYDYDYKFIPKVYGLTSSGNKVLLAGTPIIGASISDTTYFTLFNGAPGDYYASDANSLTTSLSFPYNYKGIKVIANKYSDSTRTSASALVNLTIMGADGKIKSLTTPVSSSNTKPAASSIDKVVYTSVPGITVDDDVITLKPATAGDYDSLLHGTLAKYTGAGIESNVYIAPTDSYGTTGQPVTFYVASKPAGSTFDVSTYGTITYGNITSGQKVTISAVTSNGLVKTIQLDFE